MSKEYKDMFEELKKMFPRLSYRFDELSTHFDNSTLENINFINFNERTLTDEQWQEYYNKHKDNTLLIFNMIEKKNCPINIVEDAVKRVMNLSTNIFLKISFGKAAIGHDVSPATINKIMETDPIDLAYFICDNNISQRNLENVQIVDIVSVINILWMRNIDWVFQSIFFYFGTYNKVK